MNDYEVSFQFQQGELEWADSYLFHEKDIKALSAKVEQLVAQWDLDHEQYDFECSMQVIFAQDLDNEVDGSPEDITDELPAHVLAD